MESARHVFRVFFLLLVAVVVVVLGRSLLVPRSYGAYGPYRFDNVAEQAAARVPQHGGAASCGACHAERLKAVGAGAHAKVSCEICHAPLAQHAKGTTKIADMRIDRSFTLCARCHRKIDGRPAGFPQIDLGQHQGGVEGKACIECHDPHSPKL
ncbi:cytochrome C [Anaeromyxobacter oryzae]|uniref:Cytochrome c n=1 Tax=Anaeromyxobacter oryzae TaxID=2918170 RepID=A0ABM7X160_9BACT|nr:cytochrome C [Anaeromyxobacter oryzae]BDG05469.1 cytochrome c [Anaeromyxobacter oryzae]